MILNQKMRKNVISKYRDIVFLVSIIAIFLGLIGFFFFITDGIVLFKASISIAAASRTISSLLTKMGLSGGPALAVAFAWWSLPFLISGEWNMMDPSGASGSGAAEGGGGRDFNFLWAELFGSSSSDNSGNDHSETSGDQPNPTSPNPGEPAGPEAEVYHPLLEEGQRRQELQSRLTINSIGHPLPEEKVASIIETQFQTELRIEKALRSDRVSDASIVSKRHQIRGVLFYPQGRPLSQGIYSRNLKEMEFGTHRSRLYKNLIKAVYDNLDFFLDKEGIKKKKY